MHGDDNGWYRRSRSRSGSRSRSKNDGNTQRLRGGLSKVMGKTDE